MLSDCNHVGPTGPDGELLEHEFVKSALDHGGSTTSNIRGVGAIVLVVESPSDADDMEGASLLERGNGTSSFSGWAKSLSLKHRWARRLILSRCTHTMWPRRYTGPVNSLLQHHAGGGSQRYPAGHKKRNRISQYPVQATT
jgi:hypothetical protein